MAARRRAARRSSFVETESDEASTSESEGYSDAPVPSSTPRKRSRRLAHQEPISSASRAKRPARRNTQQRSQGTYKEDSEDEEEFVRALEASDDEPAEPRPKRRKVVTDHRAKAAIRPQRRQQPGAVRRARSPESVPKRSQWVHRRYDTASERRSPYFETLPFQLWTQIFQYASYPLLDPMNLRDAENRSWLARAGTVCKALLDPAITALYKSPPIASVDAPHKLFDLLMIPGEERETSKLGFDINYNTKIQRLEFDANTLAYTAGGRGRFDLATLIPVMPQLHTIRIGSAYDDPTKRHMHRSANWNYPDNLVPTLKEHRRRLKSFEWHQSLCSKEQDLLWMHSVHQTDSFQSIEELKLSGFDAKTPKKRNTVVPREQEIEERLADAMTALPNLRGLEFEGCTALNAVLLPLLPDTLRILKINDCTYFDSIELGSFLSTRGSQLEELILEHNKSLDFGFLPALKVSCPKLEVLRIDLNYYNSHRTFLDSKPNYAELIGEDEVPSWPSSLRTVELLRLRNWTDGAARTFFKSLVDSADQLPNLRTLVIKAILSLGWRERRAFRDEWVPKLERVFLRETKLPDRHFTTLQEARTWLNKLRVNPKLGEQEVMVVIPANKKPPTPNSDNSSFPQRPRLRRGARRTNYSESSDEEAEASESTKSTHQKGSEMSSLAAAARRAMERHVQGMCDVVDVTIDNLRPTEKQFREADFLDAEPSDDEEWDPNAGDTGEMYDGWAA